MLQNSGSQAKIGLFDTGLAAYWPQLPGLKERLENYQKKVGAMHRKGLLSAYWN